MTISIWILIAILLTHWVADFVFQTHWQASNKSKNNKALLLHTITYSISWFPIGIWVLFPDAGINQSIILSSLFILITFIIHTATDYFTSRLNSKLYAKGDIHNFFVSIGGDQVLHYLQLIFTYYILNQSINK